MIPKAASPIPHTGFVWTPHSDGPACTARLAHPKPLLPVTVVLCVICKLLNYDMHKIFSKHSDVPLWECCFSDQLYNAVYSQLLKGLVHIFYLCDYIFLLILVCCLSFERCIGWSKNGTFFVRLNFHQILTNFQTSLLIRIMRKFAIILSLKIPLHLKCVATLPREMLVS